MRIVADENIPLVDELFASFASIERRPGRAIDRAVLADCDALLVRSVTTVDRALLEGSRVRFVGTCTIGTDHLDLDFFREAGIQWASAPGCNARGVVDYVLGSLLALAEWQGVALAQRCYGVVGAGQVGGRLLKVLRQLGWQVLACDPLRAADEGGDFVSLDEILQRCDVISLHTPLTREGQEATRHLFDERRLQRLLPGAWLINASRGAVVDNQALLRILQQRADLQVVLDVWEGEPLVDVELARRCRIATPHIAGYSLDGKLRGTWQVYQAFCAAMGIASRAELEVLVPPAQLQSLLFDAASSPDEAMATLCRAVYDPRRDDADFRRSLLGDEAQRRLAFDRLRKNYPPRREIEGLGVGIRGESAALQRLVRALGARLV
ncbi:4-phosphoerythronate dehydrogenase PdxB [Stutzerimonas kirkiae]|uniref:Erythronate-4-phosphate dehydrogenase n=1 Tax=Stutzerimonas kirkiae TaxID=2211392 RepID=A0A4Q9R429_9GAMM|nr:4-phosphoerythronate dehydrogenase PdxB [Stutzerimonas kirkiae]TBU93557.1 4-phosphoerythronate dehydrogenase PdxB [Stutzerimonas kirkiae]TBV01765.1 4-phosphoerythronate dehydrogenase PdxB [Stutzerimonas kirkiae]TBV11095.1 4-phosphoerythronate dehydrogenase PdxB [Stutzerimonas kirkiae]